MKVSGQLHVPAALSPRKEPGVHWIGGLVGPGGGLDVAAGEETNTVVGNRNQSPSP